MQPCFVLADIGAKYHRRLQRRHSKPPLIFSTQCTVLPLARLVDGTEPLGLDRVVGFDFDVAFGASDGKHGVSDFGAVRHGDF